MACLSVIATQRSSVQLTCDIVIQMLPAIKLGAGVDQLKRRQQDCSNMVRHKARHGEVRGFRAILLLAFGLPLLAVFFVGDRLALIASECGVLELIRGTGLQITGTLYLLFF